MPGLWYGRVFELQCLLDEFPCVEVEDLQMQKGIVTLDCGMLGCTVAVAMVLLGVRSGK